MQFNSFNMQKSKSGGLSSELVSRAVQMIAGCNECQSWHQDRVGLGSLKQERKRRKREKKLSFCSDKVSWQGACGTEAWNPYLSLHSFTTCKMQASANSCTVLFNDYRILCWPLHADIPFVICSACSHWNFLQLSWEEGIGYQSFQACYHPKKCNDKTLKGHIAAKSQ